MPSKKNIFFLSLPVIIFSFLFLPKVYAQNSKTIISDFAQAVSDGEKAAKSDQVALDHQYMMKKNEVIEGLEGNEAREVTE